MRQDLLSKVLIFATGAAIGSVVTWAVMRRKYEQVEYEYEDEPCDDCETVNDSEPEENEDAVEKENKKQNMVRYNKIVKSYSGEDKEEDKKEEVDEVERPYRISIDDYAEMDDYETATLYYYADGLVTDESDNIIDDVDDIVGEESLKAFEDEDCDSVYVRNDARKCDYEILRDTMNYYDK